MLYKNLKAYAEAIRSVLMYNHYGIIVASDIVAVIIFILNKKYYIDKEESEIEKKYKMIKVEKDSSKNKIFVGAEYYKTMIAGFFSGIIVVLFKLIYYAIMK